MIISDIESPILRAATMRLRDFILAPPNDTDAPAFDIDRDDYILAATILSDADFTIFDRTMTARLDLDDELHSISLIIRYDPSAAAPHTMILDIFAEIDTDLIKL